MATGARLAKNVRVAAGAAVALCRRAWSESRLRVVISRYFAVLTDPGAGWPRRLRYAAGGAAAVFGLGLTAVLLFALVLTPFTPGIAELKKAKSERPGVVRSVDGKELATYRRLNREWVKLSAISPSVIDSLVATEDHRFFQHHGIDFRRTLAAAVQTLAGNRQGGSTITQQLARNLYPEQIGRSASFTRKLKEIITALKIEAFYTKEEILETYLNTVPFLYTAFGIEMAARTYFRKSAGELSLLESATLVGMLKGPSYYNPVLNPDRALARRNLVLGQMVRHGKLEHKRLESLRKRPLRIDFERQPDPMSPAPHFAGHLRKWLIEWADRNGYNIYADGLVVFTTLDSRLQAFANRAVTREMDALQAVADVEWGLRSDALLSTDLGVYSQQRQRVEPFAYFWATKGALVDAFIRDSAAYRALGDEGLEAEQRLARLRSDPVFMKALRAEKTRLQAGFVAMDPRNGHVKAWVGSRDFAQDQFDHVTQARRQPGSTFKPFVYAAALKQGMSPGTVIYDRPVEIALGGGSFWRPADGDPPSGKRMTLREGLVFSKNTITAQVMQTIGADKVASVAYDMGVRQSKLQAVPSLALGTSPISLSEVVSGYATIANGGIFIEPTLVTRIEDGDGNVLEAFVPAQERALPKETADLLLDIMRGVVAEGTGTGIRRIFGIQADVAGKTGTTQDNTDGWFILIHPQLVGGAWVGFNDNRVTMRSSHWGQGAHNALYVVGDFFRQTLGARLIDPGVARAPPREARAAPLLERFGGWLGNIFAREPRPRRPDWQRERPQLQPDEEPFARPYRGGPPRAGPRERAEEVRETRRDRAERLRERRGDRKQGRRDADDDDDDDDDD